MPLRKDIWRPAIVGAPIANIIAKGSIEGFARHWLPPMESFRFMADPFGLWRDGRLHVFVEGYDYRDRVGWIEALVYDADYALIERGPALIEPFHLSYPYVFEADGETWMLPEAHKSGRLTLYRAREFPYRWEAAHVIAVDHVPIDATPLFHDGRWWLFYTSADAEEDKTGALYVAHADRLTGPWTPHPANPVRRDPAGSRPGGTPFVRDGRITLPVQDCSATYGGAISPLVIDRLTPEVFSATLGKPLRAPADAAPFVEGLHTLSGAGDITLVDMKRTELSLHGLSIQLGERIRREIRKRR
ncbi:formyl transferase [Sphingomonas sp.]|uniref:glucosamine inositolphosphorylceramide transferase family protein n=1 Tax=Sphingomonas sp. TaxID=28214 RepID=UPI000DB10355|nr:formyl transferase [Sphingomonas sp.]PZU06888.1 MAG: formyl transferase [Sphingomonas sp.]